MNRKREEILFTLRELPLLWETPAEWARLAADSMPVFLADHAICEQQAALTALNLVAHYPDDRELVQRMTSLAAEEVVHLRRVAAILHRRGHDLHRRRTNLYVQQLLGQIRKDQGETFKLDRLLVGAMIEARSCERFTRLLEEIEERDPEVADLLFDLGPAEKRHWEMFYSLAAREVPTPELETRWRHFLEVDRAFMETAGRLPTVHG